VLLRGGNWDLWFYCGCFYAGFGLIRYWSGQQCWVSLREVTVT
jgi:hypothetical protein